METLAQPSGEEHDASRRMFSVPYPVAYEYDAFGRMTVMHTWRDEEGTPDTTQWQYDQASGLLTNKVYADGKGVSYTYTPQGQLATRTCRPGHRIMYHSAI